MRKIFFKCVLVLFSCIMCPRLFYAQSEVDNTWSKIVFDSSDRKYYVVNENDGSRLLGPFLFIDEEYYAGDEDIHRYVGMNGLSGYLKCGSDTRIITEPIFIDASPFEESSACVMKAAEEGYYYIDKEGKLLIEQYYAVAYPFEAQFCAARVDQEGDGLFELIDREGDILLNGCEKINVIDYLGYTLSFYGSGVRNGKPFVFQIPDSPQENAVIIKEFDCEDIGPVDSNGYAEVRNGNKIGIVRAYDGELVVPIQYDHISIEKKKSFGKTYLFFSVENGNQKDEYPIRQ